MLGKTIFGITLLIVLLGVTACSTDELQSEKSAADMESRESGLQAGQVIARVGNKKLTTEQLEWISRRRGGLPPSPKAIYRLAEYWIDIELLSEEATRLGLQGSKKTKYMVDIGIKEAFANAMIEHIRENTEVTEEDILDYYEKNKTTSSQIQDPPRYSFSHIRTKTLESAQAALERINQGEDINTLAQELSIYHDSRRGGKIENLIERAIKTGYGPQFLTALQEASTGDVIGPIKIRNDFYEVARLEGRRPARIRPLEEIKEQLRKTLLHRFQTQNIEEQLNALKKKANAEILFDSSLLSQRQPPSPEQQSEEPED